MPTSISTHTERRFFKEAQLKTYLLIQSEENQHASGTKNCLNLPTLFFKREHMANTKPMWTQAQKPNVSSMKCFSLPAFQCGDPSLKVKI